MSSLSCVPHNNCSPFAVYHAPLAQLSQDISDVYLSPGGKERYWEQVPLNYRKEHYRVEVMECFDSDIVEIDTFKELKAIDKTYDR